MQQLPGSLGTNGSVGLRTGQCAFAAASLLIMSFDAQPYSYSVLCFMVVVMVLVLPWSLTLAALHVISNWVRRPVPPDQGILWVVVLGDWVLSFMSLAASCSAASVTSVLLDTQGGCDREQGTIYQLSAAMVFLSWFFSISSSLLNLWLLSSL